MKKTKSLTMYGVIAALYVVITLGLSATSFGAVQVRFSTSLFQLMAYSSGYGVPLVLGTLIANAFSPLGVIDMFFGGLTSLSAVLIDIIAFKFVKNETARKYIAAFAITFSSIFVALELHMLYSLPILPTWGTVALGQAISQVIGIPLFTLINKKFPLQIK